MARRRKSSGLGSLGGVFAIADKRKRSSRRGLLGHAPGINGSSRSRKKQQGRLADYFNLAERMGFGKKRRRGGGIAEQAGRAFRRDRMGRTERLSLQNEIDATIENDDQLAATRSDHRLRQDETFIQRLIRLARERFRKPVL